MTANSQGESSWKGPSWCFGDPIEGATTLDRSRPCSPTARERSRNSPPPGPWSVVVGRPVRAGSAERARVSGLSEGRAATHVSARKGPARTAFRPTVPAISSRWLEARCDGGIIALSGPESCGGPQMRQVPPRRTDGKRWLAAVHFAGMAYRRDAARTPRELVGGWWHLLPRYTCFPPRHLPRSRPTTPTAAASSVTARNTSAR